MVWNNTKLLARLYYRPISATSDIIDEASWIYAAVLVLAISFVLNAVVFAHIYSTYEAVVRQVDQHELAQNESLRQSEIKAAPRLPAGMSEEEYFDEPDAPRFVIERRPLPIVRQYGWWFVSFAPANFLTAVLGLAVLYVPCVLLLVTFSESLGSLGVVVRRDYGPLLTCSLMAWAASHLPFAVAGVVATRIGFGARTGLVLWSLSALCFGLLMGLVVRTLFGTRFFKALGLVCLAALSFAIQAKLFAVVSPFMFSPFLLYYAYAMFRGDIGDIGFSLRQRQSFRRSMEEATINPRNAEAHYQLGLIFQHRHQYSEAIERFKRAVEIDASETDAHYQLGRIARSQNRLQEALDYFSTVIEQDDRHCHHEIWREIGLTYLTASMCAEADEALQRFVEHRSYDPEGLYYYGQARDQLGDSAQAAEMFQRCIEAVKTMPHYRQNGLRKWRKLAQEKLSRRAQPA
jgi:Tfp pilus assembly protein PilF